MYQSEVNKISDSQLTKQEEIKPAVETQLKELNTKKVKGITAWRLPTLAELKYLYNHYDELVAIIKLKQFIKKDTDNHCYYCTDTNGDIIGYTFNSDKIVTPNTKSTISLINGFVIAKYPQ